MRDQENSRDTGNGRRAVRPTQRPAPQGLRAAAGNAAVVQMLRQAGHPWAQEQHQHTAGCGHERNQAAATVQRSAVHDVLRAPGRPLDAPTRTDMEARLGADFSDVRIHDDTAARTSAAEVGARAYTSGNHIVIGQGGGDPHTLAHELTHVIQQRRGPVAGTDHGDGLKVSDPDDRFEREAEASAVRAMNGPARSEAPVEEHTRTGRHTDVPLQRVATRGATGSLPLPAWDRQPPVWEQARFGPAANNGPLKRMGGTSVTVTLGPSVLAPANSYGGSRPGAGECTLVNELNARDGGGWIKGHLWNDNLGGHGVSENLTPMTDSTNQNFNRRFEEPLKRMLWACANHAQTNASSPVWYGVTITVGTYGRMSADPAELEYLVPEGVEYSASYMQMDRATSVITPVAAPQGFPPEIR
ncbi:eCIS core domain-containing protein [Streptomyces werraensis]|uniref:eCIS core domain-containing protein n=1 Tax=Streptomyces werraensis TaxID=68284 RepID=UPI003F4DD88C